MKKLAIAVFALATMTACGPRVFYRWSSVQGRDCFWSCQNIMNTCSSSCMGRSIAGNLICYSICEKQGNDCASSCPDLAKEYH